MCPSSKLDILEVLKTLIYSAILLIYLTIILLYYICLTYLNSVISASNQYRTVIAIMSGLRMRTPILSVSNLSVNSEKFIHNRRTYRVRLGFISFVKERMRKNNHEENFIKIRTLFYFILFCQLCYCAASVRRHKLFISALLEIDVCLKESINIHYQSWKDFPQCMHLIFTMIDTCPPILRFLNVQERQNTRPNSDSSLSIIKEIVTLGVSAFL